MSNRLDRHTFESAYAGKAPWDIDKPQSAIAESVDLVTSPVLDAGCGTGENALFLAAGGHRVTGIDFVEEAIRRARRKATERGLTAEFEVKDALTLGDWDQRFATVIDSGLFHVLSDEDRVRYVAGLPMLPNQADGYCSSVSATNNPARRAHGASRSGKFGPLLMDLGQWKRSVPGARMCARTYRMFHSPRAGRRSGSRSLAGTAKAKLAASRDGLVQSPRRQPRRQRTIQRPADRLA
jgi:SAM-dependent methyltransferase